MKQYGEILRAIADGRDVQWFEAASAQWVDVLPQDALTDIAHEAEPPANWRVKPAVIVINGHEVPEPLRVAPGTHTRVWVPALLRSKDPVEDFGYDPDSSYSIVYLARGLCHTTKEAAEQHARALLSFTERK